jgi:hypothetical protein
LYELAREERREDDHDNGESRETEIFGVET